MSDILEINNLSPTIIDIYSRLVYKYRFSSHGSIQGCKNQLVVTGYSPNFEIAYNQTFKLVT
jgi:hypothetical protein